MIGQTVQLGPAIAALRMRLAQETDSLAASCQQLAGMARHSERQRDGARERIARQEIEVTSFRAALAILEVDHAE